MATKKPDPKKRKKAKISPGAGLKGGTSKLTKAEEITLAKGLEGKKNVNTRKKYGVELEKTQKKIREKKSSLNQRLKGKVSTLDTATATRTKAKSKKKATPAAKARNKRIEQNKKQAKKAYKKTR